MMINENIMARTPTPLMDLVGGMYLNSRDVKWESRRFGEHGNLMKPKGAWLTGRHPSKGSTVRHTRHRHLGQGML